MDGVTLNVDPLPACTTVTFTGVAPLSEIVMFAVLASVDEFAVPVAVSVPFPDPDGVTVHQAASLVADQLLLASIVKLTMLAEVAAIFCVGGETIK